MANLSKVHHIVIGHDRTREYEVNINILRNAFVKGKDLLITAIYNGSNPHPLADVDNFIVLEENKGYVWGAIDAIEKGLSFVNTLKDKRDIVLLTNFDGLFFSEERYNWLIDDFIECGKPFGAGIPRLHKYPLSDLMLFRKEFVSSFCEAMQKIIPEDVDWTCEKHMRDALKVIGDTDNLWWRFERDYVEQEGRGYVFHKEYAFGHIHGTNNIEVKMDEYDIFNILKGDKKMTEIDQTIKRAKPTPVAKEVEKTQSFTAAFASDAHVAAERAFADSDVQIVSTEESDAGDAGTTVTVTFK